MKQFPLLKKISAAAIVLFFASWLSSCDDYDDDDIDYDYLISGSASASREVPPNSSTGTANLSGTYDTERNELDYVISWSGLTGSITEAHFAGPALDGAVAGNIHDISISTNGTNGNVSGTITVADSTETHLLSGRVYYNLHTAANPNGEVRGQVSLTIY